MKPLWTLDDGITYSGLDKWLTCREQFSLQWIDGLTPKKISIPLEFGSIIHYCLEHQFKDDPVEVVNRVTNQYKQFRTNTLRSSAERDTLEYILGLSKITFPYYCKYWNDDDRQLNWIGREQKFKLPYTFHTGTEERTIILRGMRDGLYTNNEVYGVFETKTKSRVVESDIIDGLKSDMQTMFYCFSTYLETGRFPNQVKYNIIRRSETYRRKNESLPQYLKRVELDIIGNPEHYFKRYTADISQEDIERFVTRTLNPILNLFCKWWDSIKKNPIGEGRFQSPLHYLNSASLVGKYGKVEMWDAIFGNLRPYTVRQDVFPELTESFQVTWDDLEGNIGSPLEEKVLNG